MPQGELQDYSVESVASSLVLILGGIGAVLTILLSSRCACRVRVGLSDTCYIFDCSRTPPPDPKDEEEILKKEDEIIKKEDEIIIKIDESKGADKDIELKPKNPVGLPGPARTSFEKDREPEPEPEMIIP
tara:strand:- start:1215 stop:1604 length:390 start_codon:yes stop_codon:yes gene_type:complete